MVRADALVCCLHVLDTFVLHSLSLRCSLLVASCFINALVDISSDGIASTLDAF